MKKILIYKNIIPNGEYDVLNIIDYSKLYSTVQQYYQGSSPNWGNRLWLQGLLAAIGNNDNQIDMLDSTLSVEDINERYDYIVLPMANIFNKAYLPYLQKYSEIFEKIKVPTFVISCGVQADSYDLLNQLIESIGKESSRFIRAIYNTNGEFALRGYFTKEFFDKLGFGSAVVTGCPSIYQNGRDLHVEEKKVPEYQLNPIFNGLLKGIFSLMKQFPESLFFDQNRYFSLIYDEEWKKEKYFELRKIVNEYGIDSIELILENKVRLFPDIQEWHAFLTLSDYNFSFGNRIHGSIMPILSGIPSLIHVKNSRTREMAEFFDIPVVFEGIYDKKQLYNAYLGMDYRKFNNNFSKRFDHYESFLVKCGLINKIELSSDKWVKTCSYPGFLNSNQKLNEELSYRMHRYRFFFDLEKKLRNM